MNDDLVEMTDAEEAWFQACVKNPKAIKTEEECTEALDILERDIESIWVQLETYKTMVEFDGEPGDQRRAWFTKAVQAYSWKRMTEKRIIERRKSLRGSKGVAQHINAEAAQFFIVEAKKTLPQAVYDNMMALARQQAAAMLECRE